MHQRAKSQQVFTPTDPNLHSSDRSLRPWCHRTRRPSLTEVAVVELARLDPHGGARAQVDAEADHVVQLVVREGLRDVTAPGQDPNAPRHVLPGVPMWKYEEKQICLEIFSLQITGFHSHILDVSLIKNKSFHAFLF